MYCNPEVSQPFEQTIDVIVKESKRELNYNLAAIQDQPPSDCFRLSIRENFHGRNKSEVTIRSCFSWTLTQEAPTSGIALLEVNSITLDQTD